MRTLKIGIAGTGFGREVHLPAFRGLPDIEVAGLLARDGKHADAGWGVPVFTDIDEWLALPLDAVSLALPPVAMADVARRALAKGIPVLAEKPLAVDEAAARDLVRRSEGRTNAVDFEFAELRTFQALHDMIGSGALGAVRNVSVTWLTRSWAHRGGGCSWKTDATAGGGVLTLLGAHVFYLLELLLPPVSRLTARTDSRATEAIRGAEGRNAAADFAHVLLDHADGVTSSVTMGNAVAGQAAHRWVISGERGTAVIENAGRDYMAGFKLVAASMDGKVIAQLGEPAGEGDGRIAPFQRVAARFIEAVRTGGRCRPDFSDGARVAALIDAVYRAARQGNWQDVSR